MVRSSRDLSSQGLRKLLDDLALSHPRINLPDAIRTKLIRRIDGEPARVETDEQGRIISTNPAFSALCGYSFQEIRGRKPGSFLQGEGTDPASVAAIRRALKRREPVEVDMVNYHKNGSPYRVHISIVPIFDSRGRHTGFRAIERKIES